MPKLSAHARTALLRLARAHRAAAERARVAQWRASVVRAAVARALLSRPGLALLALAALTGLVLAVRSAASARAEAATQAARLEAVLDAEQDLASTVASMHEKVASLQAVAAEAEGRSRFWAARAALAEEALVGARGRASASGSGGAGVPAVAVGADSASPPLLLTTSSDAGQEEGEGEGDDDEAFLRLGSVSPSFGDLGGGRDAAVAADAVAAATPASVSAAAPAPPPTSASGSASASAVLLLASTEKEGAPGARYGRALCSSLDFGPYADPPQAAAECAGASGEGGVDYHPLMLDENAAPAPAPAGSATKAAARAGRPFSGGVGGARSSAVLTPLRNLARRLSGAGDGPGSASKKARTVVDAGLKTVASAAGPEGGLSVLRF